MPKALRFVVVVAAFLLVMAACAPQASNTATEPPALDTAAPTAQASTAEPTAAATEAPTEAPINLAGPTVGTLMQWFDNSVLVFVPKGEFTMGGSGEDNPEHKINLSDLWIYRNKVTNSMYALCVASGACTPPASDPTLPDYTNPDLKDRPIVGVTWEQAENYCKGMGGRLPTEAEWEKTARGPDANLYPWGSGEPTCDLLNFKNCVGGTSNVLSYPGGMSFYKAADMEGNTFEWVADWYDPTYYTASPADDPLGPEVGQVRSVRSSGYAAPADDAVASKRFNLNPQKYKPDLGFRCVVVDPPFAPFCSQAAYVPGQTGTPGNPPSGGQGTASQPGTNTCQPPKPSLTSTNGCYNKGSNPQLGDLHAVAGPDTTFNGYSGPATGCTLTSTDAYCWGVENDSITLDVCTSCAPSPAGPPVGLAPSCDPGYSFDSATGMCVYKGAPPMPNPSGLCPAGYYYDTGANICVAKSTAPSPACPTGYSYDTTSQCCTASFAAPNGGVAGIPSSTYPACPIGYTYDAASQTCYSAPPGGGLPTVSCSPQSVSFGNCANPTGNSCNLNADYCKLQYRGGFNKAKCCCTYPTSNTCIGVGN